jgi:hypothetical protein
MAPFGRVAELLDELSDEVLNARIQIAQKRDDMLTEAEQVAMLDVYAEFGR